MDLEGRIIVPWKQIWHRPRAALRDAIERPRWTLLLAPLASGVVQSLAQAANNAVGQRGASTLWILGAGLGVGTLWGLVQVHVVAGALYVVARDPSGERIPFGRVRAAMSLAYAPLGAAVLAWLLATFQLGAGLYSDPADIAYVFGPITGIEVGLLYLGTFACALWSIVLEVLAVAELRRSSVGSAIGTLLMAGLLLAAVTMVVLFVVILAMNSVR